MSDDTPPLVAVSLGGIPVSVWARTQERIDDLLREFTLIAAQLRDQPESCVPTRLVELVQQLTSTYGGLNIDQENRLAEAAARGVAEIDLVYRVPPQAAEAARWLQEALDDADSYCRAGEHLLTLAAPPELLRFRRWFLEEFIDQLAGAPPTRYCDYQGSFFPRCDLEG